MTVHEAVLQAVNRKWVSALDLVQVVRRKTGHRITDSNATARVRDLRKAQYGGHPVSGRWFEEKGKRVFRYGIAE